MRIFILLVLLMMLYVVVEREIHLSQDSGTLKRGSSSTMQGEPARSRARHSRMLTELLTHLPGLSSVDQIHLLVIADTISHFSPNVMDMVQANASLHPTAVSTLGDSSAACYATASMGVETVDECGLRFLMVRMVLAHQAARVSVPLFAASHATVPQNQGNVYSTHHLGFPLRHRDGTFERRAMLPAFPGDMGEMRAFSIAWWLKNTNTLRICAERIAKNAFQQDPMDASLFYLAMRKKNVLMHLFKTVSNSWDPFERSMAYWLTKDYSLAANTLLEEASRDTILHCDDDFSTDEPGR